VKNGTVDSKSGPRRGSPLGKGKGKKVESKYQSPTDGTSRGECLFLLDTKKFANQNGGSVKKNFPDSHTKSRTLIPKGVIRDSQGNQVSPTGTLGDGPSFWERGMWAGRAGEGEKKGEREISCLIFLRDRRGGKGVCDPDRRGGGTDGERSI